MERITKNFTMEEMSHSNTAKNLGISNVPNWQAKENLRILATVLLQPLREHYGKPMIVSSGYRNQEVNRVVGGVRNSQHIEGKAVDIKCENPRLLLKILINTKLMFDQAILYDDGKNNFLHLSFNAGKNRMQVIYSKGTKK